MVSSYPAPSSGRTPLVSNSEVKTVSDHELVASSSSDAGRSFPSALPPVRSIRVLLPQFFGMYVSYTVYALLYEAIIKHPGFLYPFSFALTVVQYVIYALLSYIRLSFFHTSPVPSPPSASPGQGKVALFSSGPGAAPTSTRPSIASSVLGIGAEGVSSWRFVLIAFLTFLSSSLTSFGCHRLPYPLLVMLKSCKVLPTVIVGRTLFGTRYRRAEIAAVGLLTLGAALAAADAVLFTHPHAVPRGPTPSSAVAAAGVGAGVSAGGAGAAVGAGGGLMRLRASAHGPVRSLQEPSATSIATAAATEFVPFPSPEAASAALTAVPVAASAAEADAAAAASTESARRRLRRARMSSLPYGGSMAAAAAAEDAGAGAGSRYTLTTDDAAATIAASEGDYSFTDPSAVSDTSAPASDATESAPAATPAADAAATSADEVSGGGMSIHWPTLIGVLALLGSLGSDALTNNLLEDTLARARVPPAAVIFRVKSTAAVCAATAAVASGCLPALWDYLCARPEVLRLVLAFGICGWAGESCLMAIVAQWGAVLGTALAAGRKMGTVVLSMLVFPKRKGPAFLAGVGIVFLGVGLQVAAKAAKGGKDKAKGQGQAAAMPLQGSSARTRQHAGSDDGSEAETDVEAACESLELKQISKSVASVSAASASAGCDADPPISSLGLSIAAPAPPTLAASFSSTSSGPASSPRAAAAAAAAAGSASVAAGAGAGEDDGPTQMSKRDSARWRWEVAAAGLMSPAAVDVRDTPIARADDHRSSAAMSYGGSGGYASSRSHARPPAHVPLPPSRSLAQQRAQPRAHMLAEQGDARVAQGEAGTQGQAVGKSCAPPRALPPPPGLAPFATVPVSASV